MGFYSEQVYAISYHNLHIPMHVIFVVENVLTDFFKLLTNHKLKYSIFWK